MKSILTTILLALIVLVGCAQKQPKQSEKLIPRQVIFDLEQRKERFALSPDGQTVFYIKHPYQPNVEPDLYYASVDNPTDEQQLTFEGPLMEFYPFENDIVIARIATPAGQKIVKADLSDKSIKDITPFGLARAKIAAVRPAENTLAMIVDSEEVTKGTYKLHIESGQSELIMPAEGFYPVYFDNELNIVAGERRNELQGRSFFYRKGDEWVEFRKYPWSAQMFLRPGVNNIISVSSQGDKVYFLDNKNQDKTSLKSVDIETGEEAEILSEQRADFMNVSIIYDDGNKPMTMIYGYGGPQRLVIDESLQKHFDFLTNEIKELHILDYSADRKFWLVEDMNGGANVSYLYHTEDKSLRRLFTDHPALEDYPEVLRHNRVVNSFDGLELPINVYISVKYDNDKDGIPDKPMPTVLYVHGGPWQGWMNNFYLITRNLHLLADRGYAVIFTDFRGALTFGKEFLEKGNHQWATGMLKDKVAIAEWAIESEIAHKDKIGIFGWSYGGYAAMAGLAFAPETYACGISMYGPSYLDETEDTTGFAYSPNSLARIADLRTEEGLKLAREQSPLHHVEDIEDPLLLTTGSLDEPVPQRHADRMAEAMDKANKDVIYFYYPEEPHDYRAKESWVSFWAIAEKFLHDQLGGEYELTSGEVASGNYKVVHGESFINSIENSN